MQALSILTVVLIKLPLQWRGFQIPVASCCSGWCRTLRACVVQVQLRVAIIWWLWSLSRERWERRIWRRQWGLLYFSHFRQGHHRLCLTPERSDCNDLVGDLGGFSWSQ
jgi:hypothetical protein